LNLSASQFVPNRFRQLDLSRVFYQQKGKFCIEIAWGKTIPEKVGLKIYQLKSYFTHDLLINDETQDVSSKFSLFKFYLQEDGIYRTELKMHSSCSFIQLSCNDAITFINNCSNTCRFIFKVLLFFYNIALLIADETSSNLVSAEEGSKLIGCQTVPETSHQKPILEQECTFFNGWIVFDHKLDDLINLHLFRTLI
jgi:hypothetical protein